MEFEYTATIYIEPADLRRMYLLVKKGVDFDVAFDTITAEMEDCDYFCAGYIKGQVKEEINRRLKQAQVWVRENY